MKDSERRQASFLLSLSPFNAPDFFYSYVGLKVAAPVSFMASLALIHCSSTTPFSTLCILLSWTTEWTDSVKSIFRFLLRMLDKYMSQVVEFNRVARDNIDKPDAANLLHATGQWEPVQPHPNLAARRNRTQLPTVWSTQQDGAHLLLHSCQHQLHCVLILRHARRVLLLLLGRWMVGCTCWSFDRTGRRNVATSCNRRWRSSK